jgi:ABC-type antimicrobial peptide transport system permease subunit
MAHDVSQRRNELAVRIVLGASSRSIRALVMGRALGLAGSGIAFGWVGAFLLTRGVSSLLFGVRATDPVVFGLAADVLLVVAALATTVPVQRAISVEPASVVRAS